MPSIEDEAWNEQYKIAAQCGDDYKTQIRATALMSIAISLKRIAIALERQANANTVE